VSSLTNFIVGVVVARTLGAADFGAFSLAWVTYSVVLNLSRGLATDPLSVRFSGVPVADWSAAVRRSSVIALLVGVLAGSICVLAGALLGSPVGQAFLALGIVLPALLLQDNWRFAFFASGEGRRAFTNDLVWALALVPALYLATSWDSEFGLVLAWGASGAVAAGFGFVQTGLLPDSLRGAWSWLRQHGDLGLRYMVENVVSSFSEQVRMYGLGVIAGLADVGAVRGAQLLLGPFLAVLAGLGSVSVPEAARVLQRRPRRLMMFCLFLGGSQAAAGLLWGCALLLLMPDWLGVFMLGSVWPWAVALIVPTTLRVVLGCLTVGGQAGLRALGASRRSLRAQIVGSAAWVVGGLIGAALDGASGSAWGVAIGALVTVAVTWWQLRRGLADYGDRSPIPSASPAGLVGRSKGPRE
jgi:O-antigen/teichoic acid export membrane protein